MARECLSVDELVKRMAKRTRTSGWDAIVSYRLDLFNAALKTGLDTSRMRWQSYSADSVKTYEMHGHQKVLVFDCDWKMTIDTPKKLEFTADGQVILKMLIAAITLVNPIMGGSPYDYEYRKLHKGWAMTIKAPISSLSASESGRGVPKKSQGAIINFLKGGAGSATPMVFDLELRDNWSVSIDWEGEKELPSEKRVPKPLLDSLKRSLRKNLGGIWFPIPLTANNDTSGATSFRPEYIIFQTYSLPTDKKDGSMNDSLACVSAYIKSNVTSLDLIPGDLKPDFCCHEADGRISKLYPIPRGYSTSIIMNRRTLFGGPCQESIWQPIKDVKNSKGTHAFSDIGDDLKEEAVDLGFVLKMTWDSQYPIGEAASYAHYDDISTGKGTVYLGDVVDAVNKSKPTLTVSDKGKITWESKIKVPFTIRAEFLTYGLFPQLYKDTYKYTIKASKEGKFEVNDLTLQGTASLASSDWTKSYEREGTAATKFFAEPCLDHLVWPAWDCNPKRNLTALTNFAKPGEKNMLTLKKDGLRIPHDFMLLGEVTK
ncbi:hypothetical protein F5Y12DRAFT_89899 [Xylaria sp. FL1777]|nr:hypothetical protein F5Y12DRAFT_89899 [Xylaria sp. FL1777]